MGSTLSRVSYLEAHRMMKVARSTTAERANAEQETTSIAKPSLIQGNYKQRIQYQLW